MYATVQNMLSRFGERELRALSDRENNGLIDEALINAALESATGEINTYVASQHPVPLVTVPVIVRDFCCDIARYHLCGAEVTETEPVRNRYKDAVQFFAKVAKGEVLLGVDPNGDTALPRGTVKVANSRTSRVFSDEALNGY